MSLEILPVEERPFPADGNAALVGQATTNPVEERPFPADGNCLML
jgi:hypothetical protein